MAENDGVQAGTDQAAEGPQFGIQKIFVKDLSFETPMGLKVFTQAASPPQVKLDVNTRGTKVSENVHEVVLTLTVTAKMEEDTAFLVEVQQSGIFQVNGFAEEQLKHVLGAVCPNFLFPYARETVDNMVVKGGFGPLNLAPVDFDALYRQAQNGQAAAPTIN